MQNHFRKITPNQLRGILDMTIKEIAKVIGCSREHVYYALKKNREGSEVRCRINKLITEKLNECV